MRRVIVGEVCGSYGVRGWIKVRSHTDPLENILDYRPWYLVRQDEPREYRLLEGKTHQGVVLAALEGIGTPEQARELRGARILVDRAQFGPTAPGEFYWVDLLGLKVRNLEGLALGVVKDIMATGANDVLIVQGERERLIPFLQPRTVHRVDLDEGEILVDWDADF